MVLGSDSSDVTEVVTSVIVVESCKVVLVDEVVSVVVVDVFLVEVVDSDARVASTNVVE